MRSVFTERLAAIDRAVSDTCEQISEAIASSTRALTAGDLSMAESVIVNTSHTTAQIEQIAEQILALSIRPHPVAHDARQLLAAFRLTAGMEAIADSTNGLAKIARSRYPDAASPPAVRGVVMDMGDVATATARCMGMALVDPQPSHDAIDTQHTKMQQLHTEMMSILRSGAWPYGVEAAADVTAICHHYSQIAHAGRYAVRALGRC